MNVMVTLTHNGRQIDQHVFLVAEAKDFEEGVRDAIEQFRKRQSVSLLDCEIKIAAVES